MIKPNEMREEAVARLKMLRVFDEAVNDFGKNGRLLESEPPYGLFVEPEDEVLLIAKELEEKHGVLVYLVVPMFTVELGRLDAFLFVSSEREEWTFERLCIKENAANAYVYNYASPDSSDFGAVGLALTLCDGVVRIY